MGFVRWLELVVLPLCENLVWIQSIWLALSIAGSVLVGLGYGFFTPWVSAFEAFRHDDDYNKFYHCIVDGTWRTIKGSCTVVQDFADICYHTYMQYMKELCESPNSEGLQPLRLQEAEARAAAAEERERAINEHLSQNLSRLNVLEANISCLRAEHTQLTRSLEKERQTAAENRQEYLVLKEEVDTNEGRVKQLEEEIRELRKKHRQDIQEAITNQELLQQVGESSSGSDPPSGLMRHAFGTNNHPRN